MSDHESSRSSNFLESYVEFESMKEISAKSGQSFTPYQMSEGDQEDMNPFPVEQIPERDEEEIDFREFLSMEEYSAKLTLPFHLSMMRDNDREKTHSFPDQQNQKVDEEKFYSWDSEVYMDNREHEVDENNQERQRLRTINREAATQIGSINAAYLMEDTGVIDFETDGEEGISFDSSIYVETLEISEDFDSDAEIINHFSSQENN